MVDIEKVFGLHSTTLNGLKPFLSRLKAWNPDSRAVLFGSRARGDFRADSDADVLIIFESKPSEAQVRTLSDMAFEALLETGVRVQPVAIDEPTWTSPDRSSNPIFLRTVSREGIPL